MAKELFSDEELGVGLLGFCRGRKLQRLSWINEGCGVRLDFDGGHALEFSCDGEISFMNTNLGGGITVDLRPPVMRKKLEEE